MPPPMYQTQRRNLLMDPTQPNGEPPPMVLPDARQRELDARKQTNRMHSASVDAADRMFTRPMGSGGISERATDGAVRSGPLSTRGATPVGRPMTPERRLETAARRMWTRGDETGAAKMHTILAQVNLQREQQQSGQTFAREQDAVNYAQQQEMFGMHQGAMDARQEQERQDRFQMWTVDKAAQEARDKQQFENQLQIFGLNQGADAMRFDRDQKAQEQDEHRRREFGLKPLPVPGTETPYFQDARGSIYTGSPAAPKGPIPEGMVPVQTQRGGTTYVRPQPQNAGPPKVQAFKNAAGGEDYRQWDDQRGGWVKVKFIDEDGDGIDDRRQGGGDQGSLSQRPAQPTAKSRAAAWKGLGGR